ncbi:MAG: zinc-ribbon domain-containing protein [Oscillospiraceae bacterium]
MMSLPPKTCSNCGTPLQEGAGFCSNCGTKTPAEPATPATPTNYTQPVAPAPQQPQPSQPQAPAYSAPAQPAPVQQTPAAPAPYGSPAPTAPASGGYAPAPSYSGGYAPAAPAYSAPQANTPGTPPASGGGYGAPPLPGYSSTGSTPPGSFTPGQPGAPVPPKKKVNPVVIILIVVAALSLIGVGLYFGLNKLNESTVQDNYDQLVSDITSATSPGDVADYESKLAAFAEEHPDIVEEDPQTLMDISVEYEDASDDESRYIDMISELEALKSSDNSNISRCARKLMTSVTEDYEVFVLGSGSGGGDDSSVSTSGNINNNTLSLDIFEDVELVELTTGEDGVGISAKNNTSKTVDYFEVLVLYYNASGNPTVGPENINWDILEVSGDDVYIAPGGTWTSDEFGYWKVTNGTDAAFAYAFAYYIEYTDGTTEGASYYDVDDPTFESFVDSIKQYTDLLALMDV